MTQLTDFITHGQLVEHYEKDLEAKGAAVYRQVAQVLRKQGWSCKYRLGETITASRTINGKQRTLDVEVMPTSREIAVTRDNSSAAIRFKNVLELATWLPKNLDEPINKGSDTQSSDIGMGDMGFNSNTDTLSATPPTPPITPEPTTT